MLFCGASFMRGLVQSEVVVSQPRSRDAGKLWVLGSSASEVTAYLVDLLANATRMRMGPLCGVLIGYCRILTTCNSPE